MTMTAGRSAPAARSARFARGLILSAFQGIFGCGGATAPSMLCPVKSSHTRNGVFDFAW
jgi:hypothetical protein